MCGIAGWFKLTGTSPKSETLDLMLKEIFHRGPDDEGRHILKGRKLALGMRRLSINDLSGGSQPYFSEDKTVAAVFNGEIYNFRELREELLAKGHEFNSDTDGEVIVHLWEEEGPSFVRRLNGMFAIALWDGNQLYLFRDRFGIKPLYYSVFGGTFYFASELKCFAALEDFPRRLSRSALRSYLTLEYVPSPFSIFEGVKKLEPAHYLELGTGGEIRLNRYWDFPDLSGRGQGSLEEWSERLREALKASVKRRLLADVPLGVFLSGGLDSSSVTSLMTEICPGTVKSFSIGFSERSFDESSYARMVAERLGTEHHEQILKAERLLDILPALYSSLDEPIADAAIIPTYLLSQFAREHVTVALAGEGADELLAGYPTYLAHELHRPFTYVPRSVASGIQFLVSQIGSRSGYMTWDFKLKKFCSGLGLEDRERHLTWMGSLPWNSAEEFLIDGSDHAFSLPSLVSSGGLVERIQELDFRSYLSDGLLVKLDRASMLSSLEARVPFLDHELVEVMAELPRAHKFRYMDVKRVLKNAMGQRLPKPVLGRPKKGFGIPISDWLRGPLRHLLDEHLQASYLRAQGVFRVEPIERLVKEHLSCRADHRKLLWTLLVFQMWFKRWRPVL